MRVVCRLCACEGVPDFHRPRTSNWVGRDRLSTASTEISGLYLTLLFQSPRILTHPHPALRRISAHYEALRSLRFAPPTSTAGAAPAEFASLSYLQHHPSELDVLGLQSPTQGRLFFSGPFSRWSQGADGWLRRCVQHWTARLNERPAQDCKGYDSSHLPGSSGGPRGDILIVPKATDRETEIPTSSPFLDINFWLKADATSLPYESISAWVSRARDVPKSLTITTTHCGGINGFHNAEICAGMDGVCLFANATFTKLLKQSPGFWRSVAIHCPAPECLEAFVSTLERTESRGGEGWDSIQSFEVVTTKWHAWPDTGDSLSEESFFSCIPSSVRELTLRLPNRRSSPFIFNNSEGVWADSLAVPPSTLQHLTSFDLSFHASWGISWPHLFDALQYCTELGTLKLDFYDADFQDVPIDKSGVILPKVRHLELRQVSRSSVATLTMLKTPALQELHISLDDDSKATLLGDRWPPQFTRSGTRSNWGCSREEEALVGLVRGNSDAPSTLLRLRMKGVFLHRDTLFHLLRDLRSLTHLELEWIELDPEALPEADDSFANLAISRPPCVPNLQVIQIINLKHPPEFEIPHLRSFVQQRSIALTLTYHDHDAALKKLEEEMATSLVHLGVFYGRYEWSNASSAIQT
ncbi:hypothetical protein NMY22_g8588 [Coprinellus aureogranulatus]|nr:hypothetical protein NMY22_g8588 [Coprinellus aureogranulatus]